MKKLNNVAHFDVDENLNRHLKGIAYSFPLLQNFINKIKNKEDLEAISFKTQSSMDPEIIENFPALKLLVTRTAGIDHIAIDVCKKKKIAVYNIPDYGAYNIAEYAMALLLTGAKNIIQAYKQTQKGDFSYQNLLSVALRGKTLGVIGTGKIGIELIKMAKAFGLKILAFDPYKNEKLAKEIGFEYSDLDTILESSDFISLHVPLTPQTLHMIGEKTLKKMKNGAVLVNTARGAIIDTEALIKHVKKFKAVCLDVLENEKEFSKNHPLLKFQNVFITPHVAFYSDETVKTIAHETIENIKRFEKGDSTNRVA